MHRNPFLGTFVASFVLLLGAAAHADPAPHKSDGPTQPAKVDDGKYTDKEGNPTYRVSDGGKMVDWSSMSGYLRYNANCIVCHGPDGAGSTYAPSLVDALKTDDYATFVGIVAGGKKNVNASEQLVMPAFGENKNVMCYIDDVYVYLRARSDGVIGRGRPADHEPKSETFKKNEDACMG